MRSYRYGDGEPEVVVVGALHGDEPCGARAIERIVEQGLDPVRPLELIIANERALEQDTRYVETDVNRIFPGDESGVHEEQLAAELYEKTRDAVTLDLHSTHSTATPFVIFDELTEVEKNVIQYLPVSKAVNMTGTIDGSMTSLWNTFAVECGRQKAEKTTDAAERIIYAFLEATGAVADTGREPTQTRIYDVYGKIRKEGVISELLVDNFSKVSKGQPYVKTPHSVYRAEEEFYPVLMSEDGYEHILGFKANRGGYIAGRDADVRSASGQDDVTTG